MGPAVNECELCGRWPLDWIAYRNAAEPTGPVETRVCIACFARTVEHLQRYTGAERIAYGGHDGRGEARAARVLVRPASRP